jgi:hypothetical protein
MSQISRFRSAAGLVLLILLMTGCASSPDIWTVRTSSTLLPRSSNPVNIDQEAVALLTPLAPPSLRGNEVALSSYLDDIIKEIVPAWKVIDEQQTINLINRHGLAEEYARLRESAEQSHILDRELLKKIGKSIEARYVFQPRLAYVLQTMTDRLNLPPFDILILQTRSAHIRLSLQLWDTMNGELIWSSAAETALQSEAVNQDPVFVEDAARITWGSMLSDLLNGKTSSRYTRLNRFLDNLLIEKTKKTEKTDKTDKTPRGESDQGQVEEYWQ